jgi:hypothetical protein
VDSPGDEPGQDRAQAGRDAYVAGRDIVFNYHRAAPGGAERQSGPRRAGSRAPGLGERLFSASVGPHSGKLSVAFGPDDTLVVTGTDGTVSRWPLSERGGPSDVPDDRVTPLRDKLPHGASRVAVSTTSPALAFVQGRGRRLTVVHFTGGSHRVIRLDLGLNEELLRGNGERFATYDGRRVAVRNFADGKVTWEQPCPPRLAAVALDVTGTAVALASGSNWLAAANRITVTTQGGPRQPELGFANHVIPSAGCQLGLSPRGEYLFCVSYSEMLLARPASGEVARRPVRGHRLEVWHAVGPGAQRLICLDGGQVLWLRGHRVVDLDLDLAEGELRCPARKDQCDDIEFDHANARLAMVSRAGQVDVYQWHYG